MKRVLSLLLAVVIIFSFCLPAFAESKRCRCDMTPVVFVHGLGEKLYKDLDTDNPELIYPIPTVKILKAVPSLMTAVFTGVLVGNPHIFGTFAMKAVETIFEDLVCDSSGNPKENTGAIYGENLNADTHKIPAFTEEKEYYTFAYDWRISPVDNAKILRKYISDVKELTGHREVILAAHSQGNTVLATYLQMYSSDGIEKVVCLSPAFGGLSLIGEMYKKEINASYKGDNLVRYLKGIIGYDDAQSQLIISTMYLLNEYGILDWVLNYFQFLLDDQFDRIFDECLVDVFGSLPGLWTFVPAESYEEAKEMFGNDSKYDELIEKTDYYYYNVQTKLEEIFKAAKRNGTDIVIAAGYNISTIPVTNLEISHSDFLIDTEYMTIGATCAPFGETLGENYVQKNRICGHNHISPENNIDASTCAFPEYTWFFSEKGHNDFEQAYCDFVQWAVRYDGQPTIHSDKRYPQFLKSENGKWVPNDGDIFVETRSNEEVIFTTVIGLIKERIHG